MIARLVRNKFFWLIVVTVFSLGALSITSRPRDNLLIHEKALSYIYVPMQKGLAYVAYNTQNALTYFNDAHKLSLENKALLEQVARLEEENRRLLSLEHENKWLRDAMGLKGRFENYHEITCRIIAKEAGNWFNLFTIDKGTRDGIDSGMTVITPKGLIGQTVSATPNSATVMAIIDSGSFASARLAESRDLVGVRGDLMLKDNGLVKLVYIPVGVQITEGDTVETSGMGGIFPPGIIIGKVVSVDNDKPQLMRSAVVQPGVDFKRLEQVIVLKKK